MNGHVMKKKRRGARGGQKGDSEEAFSRGGKALQGREGVQEGGEKDRGGKRKRKHTGKERVSKRVRVCSNKTQHTRRRPGKTHLYFLPQVFWGVCTFSSLHIQVAPPCTERDGK
jgi:hypothetical protein